VTSYDTLRPATLEASGGNPNLKPYLSTNFDVSVEWYPAPTTTLSAAPFYKHINDFIVTTIEPETVTIANADNIPVGGVITGPNEATFQVARPRNAEAANVWGLELNAVHTFDTLPGWLSGFGMALNATFVDTNRDFGSISPEVRFAVVGLSDSKNATIFYEKYGFSARIAYNLRDAFLSSIAEGYGSEPLFVREYDQVDASVSYDVTDNATVFIEGTNILDNEYVTQARFSNQIRGYYEYGARYNAGFRLTF
jgi:iron complex outermembrane recepter protein